jgi:GntR family transcriptional regulator
MDVPTWCLESTFMTIPLSYRGIANDITARIAAGEYPPGSKIPSYAQLAALYSVSVSTAQRAVMALEERGVVVGVQGRGVFVKDDRERRGPDDSPGRGAGR